MALESGLESAETRGEGVGVVTQNPTVTQSKVAVAQNTVRRAPLPPTTETKARADEDFEVAWRATAGKAAGDRVRQEAGAKAEGERKAPGHDDAPLLAHRIDRPARAGNAAKKQARKEAPVELKSATQWSGPEAAPSETPGSTPSSAAWDSKP